MTKENSPTRQLKRQVDLYGAILMGLGSIIGTGVFVSIGIAAGITGPSVILAVMVGAGVATANGLNSAQLAANHPVSGGTYEYGYRYLNAPLGFTAGWMFLLAKSASAATATLGFAGYLSDSLNLSSDLKIPIALGAVIILTGIVIGGIRRSNITNTVIVSMTLIALASFILIGFFHLQNDNFSPFFAGNTDKQGSDLAHFLNACALMFVIYTGYGRIATLGEEVHEPRRTIPRAIIATLIITMFLYTSTALVAVGVIGAGELGNATEETGAPLQEAAKTFDVPILPELVALGAMTAMLGVLLNLILGLSRVLLAMGRRGDIPSIVARLNSSQTTPTIAVVVMGGVIAGLVLIGNVKTTWSFSAFTVLIYYAITNLAGLRLNTAERFFPKWLSIAGLFACLFLAFWVQTEIWLIGVSLIGVGLVWQAGFQRLSKFLTRK